MSRIRARYVVDRYNLPAWAVVEMDDAVLEALNVTDNEFAALVLGGLVHITVLDDGVRQDHLSGPMGLRVIESLYEEGRRFE